MAADLKHDPDLEWIDYVRPVGLVVAPVLLKELGLVPSRQTQADTAVMAAHVGADSSKPGFSEPWAFFAEVLGWEARHVAGSPGGPALPDDLCVRLPEHDTTLRPTWAVAELSGGDKRWQLLVRLEDSGVGPDARGALKGWEATPHQRFERLLRETGIFAGLLVTEKNEGEDGEDRYAPELRLIYAPSGETSGYLTLPLRALATVAGRPMLGGLKLLLDSVRLFTDADERRLPALLRDSREAQAAVSTALAEQVLGALHELLRGLDAAEPALIRELARCRPEHLYEGLLTVLMRLVFILYAEDRDLLPSRTDGRAREIYETSYAVRGLYASLVEDAALNPDTMDERRGGWGRLLALFRLIHKGHPSHFIQARGGKLFDPEQFLFLEGRADAAEVPRVLPVSDGCILRILEGLMTLQVKGGTRDRLSYRALDVEQIGSVYETVMGFTVESAAGRSLAIKAGKHNRTPVFVDLEKLAAAKGKDRIKFLKEEADRAQLSTHVAKAVEAAKTAVEMAIALDPIVDERGSPKKHEATAGTPLLQPTDERRRTGSHYTPRSLTAPIVLHALEPAFERLGLQATPEQILDLKVCDPAMGSGAFLVEACRALALKLVEAWGRYPDKKPTIPADEDEELHARRLVAQRCLYGVDKNPLATDLAKLSLWLATLARDHEFSFLDHALKSGDSLVGLTQAQIAAANWDASKPGLPLFRQLVQQRVAEAMKGRGEIQAAPDDTARAIQEARHRSLEARLKEIRIMGDAVIAAFFAADKPNARELRRQEVESLIAASMNPEWPRLEIIASGLRSGMHPLVPFHWEIEFPEVFARENGGFDAIVGNPPFAGKNTISASNSPQIIPWLQTIHHGAHGNADLVAHFFRRAFTALRKDGALGLIATNTIGQGDTRQTGLTYIIAEGGAIFRATRRLEWPGEAAVIISIIHIAKGLRVPVTLDGRVVSRISAYLVDGTLDSSPNTLALNADRAFKGSELQGSGFLFTEVPSKSESGFIVMQNIALQNRAAKARIKKILSGEDLVNDPKQECQRYAFNISDLSLSAAENLVPELVQLARDRVFIERQLLGNSPDARRRKEMWWKWSRSTSKLYQAIHESSAILATAFTSPHMSFCFVRKDQFFLNAVVVVTHAKYGTFCAAQSRPHETWARFFSSSMKDDLRYAPSDCFETFPFSRQFEDEADLDSSGNAYHGHRAALMITRNEGMTETYNRFHDRMETSEDIQRLRDLHAAMDRAVLGAYGWHDLAERADPTFLDETNEDDHTYQGRLFWPSDFRDEVLARLLALNAERHAEEIRLGIAPGMKARVREDEDDDLEEN